MKFLLIVLLISLTISCKTNKTNASGIEKSEQTNNTSEAKPVKELENKKELSVDNKPEEAKDQNNGKYSLFVSFYSKGEGIDYKNQEEYLRFLQGKPKVEYEEIRWGREGEIDYCINLNQLSTKEKEEFISETRSLLNKSNLVHIKENEPCVHKR